VLRLIEARAVLGGACVKHGHDSIEDSAHPRLPSPGFVQRGFREGSIEGDRHCITVADFMYRKDRVVAHEWKRIDDNCPSHGRPLRRQRAVHLSNTHRHSERHRREA